MMLTRDSITDGQSKRLRLAAQQRNDLATLRICGAALAPIDELDDIADVLRNAGSVRRS